MTNVLRALNAAGAYRGRIVNAENIGAKVEALVAFWNEAHPDDLVGA